jgi:hypothetical protein
MKQRDCYWIADDGNQTLYESPEELAESVAEALTTGEDVFLRVMAKIGQTFNQRRMYITRTDELGPPTQTVWRWVE